MADLPPGGTFGDDNGSTFEGLIEAIAAEGITKGCNPPANNQFCPDDQVTRGQMAVFITRAKPFASASDRFVDDNGSFYESAANRIFHAGVTNGCNPPTNNRYCGERPISRGEMAALLVRAFDLKDDGGGDLFDDDDGSQFEAAIDRLGTAGVTKGCNPPANNLFCPDDPVTRGQMAAFIARALGLRPIQPPPPILSGNVCPCTIPGRVELKGNVSLQGDLVVDGGTLIARPGVNVDGNGHQIMFMNGGRADFQGSETSTWSNDGATQNLNRDINFRDMQRIMFHDGAGKSTLRFFRISNSGTSTVGDYPLHFHLNGNSVRGTLVEGVVVVGGRHHAFVPHGSHGITFKDTIAKDTRGAAYWWDPPGTNCSKERRRNCTRDNSNDIVYDHALTDGVRPMSSDSGFRLGGFQLGAGRGNVVRNSVARNVSGDRDCAGFVWPEEANLNDGGTVWTFVDNKSWNSDPDCHGAFTWQNDGSRHHIVQSFTGSGIGHGAYQNNYEYRDVDVSYMEVHAAGWKVVGGRIGTVTALKHRNDDSPTVVFQNVDINRFVVNNGTDGGNGEAGYYVFNDTGLRCSDVTYQNVVPGTRVRINGNPCPVP